MAAVIGNTFDLGTLAATLQRSPAETAPPSTSPPGPAWCSPRARPTSCCSKGSRSATPTRSPTASSTTACSRPASPPLPRRRGGYPCQVGTLLLECLRSGGRDEDLFDVVAHLNAGIIATSGPANGRPPGARGAEPRGRPQGQDIERP